MTDEKHLNSVLRLLPVQFAPFFAAGIILASVGGRSAFAFAVISGLALILSLVKFRRLIAAAVGLLLGVAVMTGFTYVVKAPILEADGLTETLSCTVTRVQDTADSALYYADTQVNGHRTKITFFSERGFSVGDVISAEVRLSVNDFGNPAANEVLLKAEIEKYLGVTVPEVSFLRSLDEYRKWLCDSVDMLADENAVALTKGLLFGDTSEFSPQLFIAAKISGILHFTAVSGSHLVIVISIFLELIPKRLKRVRAVAAIIAVFFAVLFWGAEPTVVRAGVMLILCHSAPLFARKAEALNSLCVSVVVMTFFTPYVMLDIGFQMSVLGVFGVAVVAPEAVRRIHGILHGLPKGITPFVDSLLYSACAVICIAPVSVGVFGGISLSGVFATAVLTSLFTAALAFGIVFALTGIVPLLVPIGLLMRLAYYIIGFFGGVPWLWLPLNFEGADLPVLACTLCVAFAVLFPKSFGSSGAKAFAVLSVVAVAISLVVTVTQRKISFCSDGSSGAAVVCINRTAAVLVCGDGERLCEDLSDTLLKNGICGISVIIAPDVSIDGAQGLEPLCGLFPTERIISPNGRFSRFKGELISQRITEFTADGVAIATAKVGDTDVAADIVLYSGYKNSEPKHSAERLALYASSRQEIMPENGINIYDRDLIIDL